MVSSIYKRKTSRKSKGYQSVPFSSITIKSPSCSPVGKSMVYEDDQSLITEESYSSQRHHDRFVRKPDYETEEENSRKGSSVLHSRSKDSERVNRVRRRMMANKSTASSSTLRHKTPIKSSGRNSRVEMDYCSDESDTDKRSKYHSRSETKVRRDTLPSSQSTKSHKSYEEERRGQKSSDRRNHTKGSYRDQDIDDRLKSNSSSWDSQDTHKESYRYPIEEKSSRSRSPTRRRQDEQKLHSRSEDTYDDDDDTETVFTELKDSRRARADLENLLGKMDCASDRLATDNKNNNPRGRVMYSTSSSHHSDTNTRPVDSTDGEYIYKSSRSPKYKVKTDRATSVGRKDQQNDDSVLDLSIGEARSMSMRGNRRKLFDKYDDKTEDEESTVEYDTLVKNKSQKREDGVSQKREDRVSDLRRELQEMKEKHKQSRTARKDTVSKFRENSSSKVEEKRLVSSSLQYSSDLANSTFSSKSDNESRGKKSRPQGLEHAIYRAKSEKMERKVNVKNMVNNVRRLKEKQLQAEDLRSSPERNYPSGNDWSNEYDNALSPKRRESTNQISHSKVKSRRRTRPLDQNGRDRTISSIDSSTSDELKRLERDLVAKDRTMAMLQSKIEDLEVSLEKKRSPPAHLSAMVDDERDEYEFRMDQLRSNNVQLRGEIKEMNVLLKKSESRMSCLEEENKKLEVSERSFEAKVERLDRDLANSKNSHQDDMKGLIAENEDLKGRIEEGRSFDKELLTAKKSYQEEMKVLDLENDALKSRIEKIEECHKMNISSLNDSLASKKFEIDSMHAKLEKKEKEANFHENVRQDCAKLIDRVNRLEIQLENKDRALEMSEKLSHEYETEVHAIKSKMAAMERDVASRDCTMDLLRSQIEDTTILLQDERVTTAKYRDEIHSLRSDLSQQNKNLEAMDEDLTSQIKKTEEDTRRQEKQFGISLKAQQSKIKSLEEAVLSHESLSASLQDEIYQLTKGMKNKGENRVLKEELDDARRDVDDREYEIQCLRDEMENHKDQNCNLEDTIMNLRSELAELDVHCYHEERADDGIKDKLCEALEQNEELEKRVTEQGILLKRAENIMAKTNSATLRAVMDAVKKGKAPSYES